MSFKRFLFLLTMMAVLTMAVRVSTASDTWWHLRAGAWIAEHHAILKTDPFSLTRQGQPWIYPGWLAQLAIFFFYHAWGYAGINLLTAALILAAFLLVWNSSEARPLLKSVLVLLAATTSAVYWSARPQIFSFFLTAVFLWLLERDRKKPGYGIWFLPPLMGLWVNLHGGFALGFILIAIQLAGTLVDAIVAWLMDRGRSVKIWDEYRSPLVRLIGVGLLAAVFVGLNPHGYAMLGYPFQTVSIEALRAYIQEWQSPNFHQLQVLPFLAMLLLSLFALGVNRSKTSSTDLISAGVFTAMSLLAVRNIASYALVMTPILARSFDPAIDRLRISSGASNDFPERITRWVNAGFLVALLVPVSLKIRQPLLSKVNDEAISETFPVEAISFLERYSGDGNLFNSYNWGAYLIWRLYPQWLSFVDGRTDLFNDAILEQYITAWRGEDGWDKIFAEWAIATVLVEPDAPLRFKLEGERWQLLYEDEQAIIMARPE